MDQVIYILKYIYDRVFEFTINEGFPVWPDFILFKFVNPFLNFYITVVIIIYPMLCTPRILRQIHLESRRYYRRRLINRIFNAPPECREAMIDRLWVDKQRKAYLQDTSNLLKGYGALIYRYWYHYELMALRRLAEAKDKHRMLLLLGFIDASRFGSRNNPELHHHLASVLSAWDANATSLLDEKGTSEPDPLSAAEIHLTREGEESRKFWKESLSELGFWSVNLESSDPQWKFFYGCDNLDFVEFGPSVERLRGLVNSIDTTRWRSVCPTYEYAALWYHLPSTIIAGGVKCVLIYLTCQGHYYLSIDQIFDWAEKQTKAG